MLDEKSECLLAAVSGACKGEGYEIIEEEDLLSAFPRAERVERAELLSMLSLLAEEHCLELNYAQDGVYCVRLLAEGRRYLQRVRTEVREGRARRRDAFLFSALGAFLGGALGALLTWAASLWL